METEKWSTPSPRFNKWWDLARPWSPGPANPFEKGSAAYWAWEGWQAALAQPPLPVQEQQQVGPVEDMLLRRAVLRSAKIVSDGRFVTKQAALNYKVPNAENEK